MDPRKADILKRAGITTAAPSPVSSGDARRNAILQKAGIAPTAPVAPIEAPSGFNKAIAALDVQGTRIRPGQGSGVDGHRTVGDIAHNIGGGLDEYASGLAKTIPKIGVNLGRTLKSMLNIGDPNSNDVFNKNSVQGQYFDQSTTGNTGYQKLGRTIGDVASLFVPGGATDAIGTKAALGTEALVGAAAKAPGVVGRLARLAPSVARGVTEAATGAAAMKGSVSPSDVVVGGVVPIGISSLKAVGTLAKGAKVAAQDTFEKLSSKAAAGDSFAQGKITAQIDKTKNMFQSVIDQLPENSSPYKTIMRQSKKLTGTGSLTNERTMADLLTEHGVDGVQKNGKFATAGKLAETDARIAQNGASKEQLIGSSNGFVRPDPGIYKESKATINSMRNLRVDGQPIDSAIIDKVINRHALTPSEAYTLSKALRNEAYSQTTSLAGDSAKASAYRNIAGYLDNGIKSVEDLPKDIIEQLDAKLTEDYALKYLYDALAKVDAPAAIGKTFAKNVGGTIGMIVGGFGPQGLIGGLAGRELGGRAASLANRASGKSISPEWFQLLQKFNKGQSEEELAAAVKDFIAKNQGIRGGTLQLPAAAATQPSTAYSLNQINLPAPGILKGQQTLRGFQ